MQQRLYRLGVWRRSTHAWTKQVIKVFCFCLFVFFKRTETLNFKKRVSFGCFFFFFFFFFLIWPVKGSNLMWNHMKSLFRGCFGESQNYFNPCSHICKSINLSAFPPPPLMFIINIQVWIRGIKMNWCK